MGDADSWGALDPNSANQLWSRWTFVVETPRRVPQDDVRRNVGRWLRAGFGSTGRYRVREQVRHVDVRRNGGRVLAWRYIVTCEVEGPPAHDPGYQASVARDFRSKILPAFGPLASMVIRVRLLAGDRQDASPRDQMVVLDGRVPDGGRR